MIKARPVVCIDITGYKIHFRSVNDAARWIYGSPSNISAAASGKIKTAYGYRWEYEEEQQ